MDVELTIPADIGAAIVSRRETRAILAEHGMRVVPVSGAAPSALAHHDFGATALALAGTAVGAAAVKGLFDVINTIVKEAFETYRQRQGLEHERHVLTLKLGAETHAIDVSREFAEVKAQVDALQARWTADSV